MSTVSPSPDFTLARAMREGIEQALDDAARGCIDEVLRAPEGDPRHGVYVIRLVEQVPGIGKVAARRFAADRGWDGMTRVADLSSATRVGLADEFGVRP